MFLLLTLNIFHAFFSVSVVDFEQVNVSWAVFTQIFSIYTTLSIDVIAFLLMVLYEEYRQWSHKILHNPADMHLLILVIETGAQCVKNLFKVSNKDTRTTSVMSFWCIYS